MAKKKLTGVSEDVETSEPMAPVLAEPSEAELFLRDAEEALSVLGRGDVVSPGELKRLVGAGAALVRRLTA